MNEAAKPTYQLFCGVDIAAKTFSAALLSPPTQAGQAPPEPSPAHDFEQTTLHYQRFVKLLLKTQPDPAQILVVVEATGTYWLGLALHCSQAGLALSVINPSQTGDFARSMLIKAKNDQLDAQILARLAYTHQPKKWNPPPQLYHELNQRLVHRDQLLEMEGSLKNQLHALSYNPNLIESVKSQKEQLLASIQAQLKTLKVEITKLTDDPKTKDEWVKSIQRLQTIPGVGLLTACWLVVASLNFTTCKSAESLTQYAGLAPVERRSGTSVRKRGQLAQGGNARLRRAMYMAALSALRFNPAIKAYGERLRQAKRAFKELCCAAARKLLHIAYAMIKSGQDFDPQLYAKLVEQKSLNNQTHSLTA